MALPTEDSAQQAAGLSDDRPPEAPDALVQQVLRLIETRILDPLEILLESGEASERLRSALAARAREWAAVLFGGDDQPAALTAGRLIGALYPSDEAFDPPPQWWGTPLGHVVACRVGHPGADAVSYTVAGAMLGITRQGVHDLVVRGKLERHPQRGVTVASVQARLRGQQRTPAADQDR